MNRFPTIGKLIINNGEIQYCFIYSKQQNIIRWLSSLINWACVCDFDRTKPHLNLKKVMFVTNFYHLIEYNKIWMVIIHIDVGVNPAWVISILFTRNVNMLAICTLIIIWNSPIVHHYSYCNLFQILVNKIDITQVGFTPTPTWIITIRILLYSIRW